MKRWLSFVLLLFASQPAFAALVTLTGGILTAHASAGDSSGIIDTDSPFPVTPHTGEASLSAIANGSVNVFCLECADPVSGSSIAKTNISEEPGGGMSFTLSSESYTLLAHIGPGVWRGASANSSASVDFSISSQSLATLERSGFTTNFGFLSGQLTMDGNILLPTSNYGVLETYLLEPGQYNIFVSSSLGDSLTGSNSASATMMLKIFVPIPAAFWLFGSALFMMFFRNGVCMSNQDHRMR